MNLKKKLLGWECSNYDIYKETYREYGGSVNMHPHVIDFFLKRKVNLDFFHLKKNDKIVAAYFTSNGGCLGFNVCQDFPISYDEVLLPVCDSYKIFLPEKNDRISSLHKGVIINSLYTSKMKGKIFLVKDEFSDKTIEDRNIEQDVFLSDGGEYINLKDISARDIAEMYIYLFRRQFGNNVHCYKKNKLKDFIANVPDLVVGNCLFYKKVPCAMDLIFHSVNKTFIYYSVISGGVEPDIKGHDFSSLLMWRNIIDAKSACIKANKKMLFSIGLLKDFPDNKFMFVNATSTGKTIML